MSSARGDGHFRISLYSRDESETVLVSRETTNVAWKRNRGAPVSVDMSVQGVTLIVPVSKNSLVSLLRRHFLRSSLLAVILRWRNARYLSCAWACAARCLLPKGPNKWEKKVENNNSRGELFLCRLNSKQGYSSFFQVLDRKKKDSVLNRFDFTSPQLQNIVVILLLKAPYYPINAWRGLSTGGNITGRSRKRKYEPRKRPRKLDFTATHRRFAKIMSRAESEKCQRPFSAWLWELERIRKKLPTDYFLIFTPLFLTFPHLLPKIT